MKMELVLNLEDIYLRFRTQLIDNRYGYSDEYFDNLKEFRGEIFVNDNLNYHFSGFWGWPDADSLAKLCQEFSKGTLTESVQYFSESIEEESAFEVCFDPLNSSVCWKTFLYNQHNELTEHGITLALTDESCKALAAYLALQTGKVSYNDPHIVKYIQQGVLVDQPGF